MVCGNRCLPAPGLPLNDSPVPLEAPLWQTAPLLRHFIPGEIVGVNVSFSPPLPYSHLDYGLQPLFFFPVMEFPSKVH